MRIGVDYRILAVGRELFHRGIGRYTQQQLRAVLDIDADNEYLLLCNSGNNLSLIDPKIASAPNLRIVEYEADKPTTPPLGDPATMLRQAEEYQQWVYGHDLDLFHATAPFLFERPVLVDFDVCPMVATFYDLIPLIFPAQYLTGWWRDQYLRTSSLLTRAARLIAISEAAKSDAATYLGFPSRRIDVAWPIPDSCFRPLGPEVLPASLARLRSRIGVPDEYVLTVSHLHHTKNLHTLLRGYSELPAALRSALPLVVCCHLDVHGTNYLRGEAARLGISDDIILTGLVSDEELTTLYNGATVVVHPSRYEGFGLPVVEAMQCGAPVITTTASSLPEAAGDAALLVDPDDGWGFARSIEELQADPARRQRMRERGLAHATRFDRQQLAEHTLQSYRGAVASAPEEDDNPRRPRLAVWTPLPPQQSGISDYSVELLSRLKRHYDIELFVDDDCLPPPTLLFQYRVKHYTAIERRQAQEPFDGFLYQMGGSLFHVYMYDALRAYPGVVVLHDLTWSHVLYTVASDNDDLDLFVRQLEALEGGAARQEFDVIHRMGPLERGPVLDSFLSEHPMLGDVVEHSVAQIVHVEQAAGELRERYEAARVFTIPMGVSDAPHHRHGADASVERARRGISGSTLVLGTFGIAHASKRLEDCVFAMAQLHRTNPDVLLLVVGRSLPDSYIKHIYALADSLGVAGNVRYLGHVSRADFDEYMAMCDVIINLRVPTATHMSAVLMRALAAGKPLIMTDLPEWRTIPDGVALRVPPEGDVVPAVVAHLEELAADASARNEIAARARSFYEREGTVESMADRYRRVLDMGGARVPARPAGHPPSPDGSPVMPLSFNKVCEIEDFSQPELVATIRDVCSYKLQKFPADFPKGTEHRKDWEIAMAVRTLRDFGALHSEATILGVAAGAEDTSFYLTREARQVFATDRYLDSGEWQPTAPLSMLVQPQDVAPFEFDANRLVVQHMDGRHLRYPDNTFDGIYSSGSIEHFGDLQDVANAAYEMGRVLKPGGVLTLSTEIRLSGPPGGIGWPGLTLLFSPENLQRFIIDASGLEPVDELDLDVSETTLSVRRDLTLAIQEHLAAAAARADGDERDDYSAWEFPHIILVHEGYAFTSVHLALRKSDSYPRVPNQWAKPSSETVASIEKYNHELVLDQAAKVRPAPAGQPTSVTGAPESVSQDPSEHVAVVRAGMVKMHSDCAEINERIGDLDQLLAAVDGHIATVDFEALNTRANGAIVTEHAGEIAGWAALVAERSDVIAAATETAGSGTDGLAPAEWHSAEVALNDLKFHAITDPRIGDQVTATLATGRSLDEPLVQLMLDVIAPGEKILDLGAHVGTFSLAAAAIGAHSLAVEASPQNAALLRASIARNGFRNVVVIEAVASDVPGEASFQPHGPWGQVVVSSDSNEVSEHPEVTVAAVTIDDLVDELGWRPLRFVKIDVEGWEIPVLRGMRRVLEAPDAPAVLYECNGHTLYPFGATPEALIREMEGFGYTSYLVEANRLVRVRPEELQPQTLVDYLAVKSVPMIEGWTVEPALTLEERVSRIVTDCSHANYNHRLYMARALERAEAEVMDHPEVMAVIEALHRDPLDEVRSAIAAWSLADDIVTVP
ncbi:MAG TPA: FkbM family methyltransferase [Acidimicrobiales bacterium]|nr:FkbM family methyltransferase [Acidimicrobiales bacterium]